MFLAMSTSRPAASLFLSTEPKGGTSIGTPMRTTPFLMICWRSAAFTGSAANRPASNTAKISFVRCFISFSLGLIGTLRSKSVKHGAQEAPEFRRTRRLQDLARRPVLVDAALMHEDHAVG